MWHPGLSTSPKAESHRVPFWLESRAWRIVYFPLLIAAAQRCVCNSVITKTGPTSRATICSAKAHETRLGETRT
jgi:hypothetical protein